MSQAINDLRARYNANGNGIIPNTFQHPNIFIDKLMYFLTPEENVGLTFAVRRILGFQSNIMSRRDNISLSQFTDGITAEDGHVLSHGCGLGVNTIRQVLENLEKFKILLPTTEKPNPVKGQEYWLQDNENSIDWAGLEERKNKKITYDRAKTEKATAKSLNSRGYVARKAPVTSHVTPPVTWDVDTKPTETHRNPQTTTAATIFSMYESNIGPITSMISDALNDAIDTFTADWVKKAIEEAAKNNVRKMSYINAILNGYKERGNPDTPREKPSKKTNQESPLEKYAKSIGAL